MKPIDKETLYSEAKLFLSKVFSNLNNDNIILEKNWQIDHLCYRTSTLDNYSNIKNLMNKFSKLLIESEVNGRLISTFKLATPISFDDWEIDLIEVPAPKAGKICADGFEHFEIVCDLTFDEIKKRYHKCKFDESGLSKEFNQELEIPFDGFAIKFHHLSLQSVINLEANKSIFSALKNSKALELLRQLSPLVAGTFPLNIHVSGSDLDILICSIDFNFMKNTLIEKFGSYKNFKLKEIMFYGEQTVIASFAFQEVDFEIFGQRISSVKQRGYLHFLIEERLLKIGGISFENEIKEARRQGLKTEPAFAEVLGLNGDPYTEMLKLQKKTYQELRVLMR